jgi:hypothetical protein
MDLHQQHLKRSHRFAPLRSQGKPGHLPVRETDSLGGFPPTERHEPITLLSCFGVVWAAYRDRRHPAVLGLKRLHKKVVN